MQPLFLFKVFGVPFFSYTTLVIAGVVLAWLTVVRACLESVRGAGAVFSNANPMLALRAVNEAFACVALGAVVGGRVMHIAYNIEYFVERPSELWRYLDGGVSLVGVCIGGVLALWLWCRWRRVSLAWALDVAALPVAVLAALAWLGAFLHGSQYGAPVDHALALELRDTYGVVVARWPTQLYAAVWCALCGLWLLWWGKGNARLGLRATAFIITYSMGLFLLDFTRGDASIGVAGLRLTQWLYGVGSGLALAQRVVSRR
jgi:phosphatidylglycerol:prolipoprotein diacylglycerol transferase